MSPGEPTPLLSSLLRVTLWKPRPAAVELVHAASPTTKASYTQKKPPFFFFLLLDFHSQLRIHSCGATKENRPREGQRIKWTGELGWGKQRHVC